MTNELTLIVEQNGLQEGEAKNLMASFGQFYDQAKALAEDAKIVVTEESQTDLMLKARETRLKLKDIRVAADKVRKELKEKSLREGRAIDGFANIIKALIVPIEEHLEKQEKFAELKQAERFARIQAERVTELSKYVVDVSVYDLKAMSDKAYEQVLASSKELYEMRKAAELRAEEDRKLLEFKQDVYRERILKLMPYSKFLNPDDLTLETTNGAFNDMMKEGMDKQKKYEDEQAAIQAENERLKKAALEKERLAAIEKQKQDEALAKERRANEEKLAAAKKLTDDAERKLREQKEAQLEKERKEKEAAEASKRADEDMTRKTLLAPDKEKLVMLAGDLSLFKLPTVQSREAGQIMEIVSKKIDEVVLLLQEGARKL